VQTGTGKEWTWADGGEGVWMGSGTGSDGGNKGRKVETPIHDSIRELVTWECKKYGVKS
jgi:hypothetical protein